MTTFSTIAQRTASLFAAAGMTAFMLIAYFHVPATHAVQGLVA